jgi:hypothetical protein
MMVVSVKTTEIGNHWLFRFGEFYILSGGLFVHERADVQAAPPSLYLSREWDWNRMKIYR